MTQKGKPASLTDMGGTRPTGVEMGTKRPVELSGYSGPLRPKWLSLAAEKSLVAMKLERPYRNPTLVDG
jgi:hypothetical protein